MQIAGWKFGCRSTQSEDEPQRGFRVSKHALGEELKNIAVAKSSFAFLLAMALALGSLSCGVCERPFVSSISPNSIIAGSNHFLLTINGSDFRQDSVVVWNGLFLTTGFVSSRQLAVTITAVEVLHSGSVLVFVVNPGDGNTTFVSGAIGANIFFSGCAARDSNAVVFNINP